MNLIKLLLIVFKLCYVWTQTNPKKSLQDIYNNPLKYETKQKTEFRQLQDFLTESVNNFKLEFHRSLEESRIRMKQKNGYWFSLPDKGGIHSFTHSFI